MGKDCSSHVVKSWHLHKGLTCGPTSLTLFCMMPENIWTGYNFCCFQMQHLVYFHLQLKDFCIAHVTGASETEVTEGEINPLPPKHRKWLTVSPPAGYTNPFLLSLLCFCPLFLSLSPAFLWASLSLPLPTFLLLLSLSFSELPALLPHM